MSTFSSHTRNPVRRILGAVLVLALSLGLSGCWVTSLNPLYEENTSEISQKDPDIVFEPSLIGSWVDTSDRCVTLTIASEDNEVYELRSRSTGEKGCNESPSNLQARLVKLDNHYFMDLSPMEDDVCPMCLPQHQIFLAQFDKAKLSLTPIDGDWLKKALATKTVTFATVAGHPETITSSSKDLKAFCRRYAEDKEVFRTDSSDGARLVRK